MSNIGSISDVSVETLKFFKDVFQKKAGTLDQYVRYTVLNDSKLKSLVQIIKLNKYQSYKLNADIMVVINEDIFNMVYDDKTIPELLFEEELAKVYYDSEKDVIKLLPADLQTFKSVIKNYGIDEFERAKESITAAVDQLGLGEKKKESKK